MKKPGVIGCLAISAALFGGVRGLEYVAQGPLHYGAPPLVYPCPPGHTLVQHWEKGTAHADQPGTLAWHGWTRWASCSQSTTLTGEKR